MSRNLLPRFRREPNPVNVPAAAVGVWTPLQSNDQLAQLDYGDAEGSRTDVQSIPSPWARLILFQHALEDERHPARGLVTTELLDALEFLWAIDSLNVQLTFKRIDFAQGDLQKLATNTSLQRVVEFADAVTQLKPEGVSHITLVLANGRPVLASSPFTLLFTAEDAARHVPGKFFRFANHGEVRGLRSRPRAFQEYVARVVLPQVRSLVNAPAAGERVPTHGTLVELLNAWLGREVAALHPGVAVPEGSPDAAASDLELQPLGSEPFGGAIMLYKRSSVDHKNSPWVLRPGARRARHKQPPIVVDPNAFDGFFYEGAPHVKLPATLPSDRKALPVLGVQYDWVYPAKDWLTEEILLLADPIEPRSVKGLADNYHGRQDDTRFGVPRLLLPLKADFFRYFSPDEVERMLRITVLGNGGISVVLKIPVGPESAGKHITVQHLYEPTSVRREAGPSLALWPSFQWRRERDGAEGEQDRAKIDEWSRYLVFRRDATKLVADNFDLLGHADGVQLASVGQRRTELAQTLSFDRAPEVLEVINTAAPSDGARALGVILPRLERRETRAAGEWHVGVDFGTSNTVVSIHSGTSQRILSYEKLLLNLTEPSAPMPEFLAAYFFPSTLSAKPFGTAVVHVHALSRLELEHDPLGVRVNIPFSGYVKGGNDNQVRGDLKWSVDPEARFLSASFLRHLLSTVVAEALYHGIDPSRIRFSWSYPRAFSGSDIDKLGVLWSQALSELPVKVQAETAVKATLDESRAVLRYFFNKDGIGLAGRTKVIVDVGGGTSDIAAYGEDRTRLLDSVLLGGRDLTGTPLRGNDGSKRSNPFVEQFAAWALKNGLPQGDQLAVRAYLESKEAHLAFGYIVASDWYARGKALPFSGEQTFRNFQSLVFYLFGALFYYLGLSLREPVASEEERIDRLPSDVRLAGNGSRYLEWLTGMKRAAGDADAFRVALRRLLAAGAGINDVSRVVEPSIRVSDAPKQEVALGLVGTVEPSGTNDASVAVTPVAGEAVRLGLGSEGACKELPAYGRFEPGDFIAPTRVSEVKWLEKTTEIERFHAALLRECPGLTSYDSHWNQTADDYRRIFDAFGPRQIQQATLNGIEHHASQHGEYRGSIFILEASVVLEHLMRSFFGGSGTATSRPAPSSQQRGVAAS